MLARIVDLRYKMKDVLKALERKESVKIIYHGKEKGIIVPSKSKEYKKVTEHPFFGVSKEPARTPDVQDVMDKLRSGRYRDGNQ